MKKIITIFIILIVLSFIPNGYAHEMYSNGWHIVPSSDSKSNVWAQYTNGVETKRYSLFMGVHRGWGDAPENSLAAFKSVKNHGYYGFETDVRFTKDNVAVLCHDSYINDLAVKNDLSAIGDKVYVKNVTYSQLKNNYVFNIQRLNSDSNKKLSNYKTNRITTFEEMIDFVKANNMFVAIELKDGTREQIASIVRMAEQKGVHNNVKWISFNVSLLEYVKDADGDENLGVLVNSEGNCNGDSNKYCTGDGDSKASKIFNRLKTNNNSIWFGNYTSKYKLPSTNFGNNLPKEKSNFESKVSSYTLKTIPQGKISINTNSVNTTGNNSKEISYSYNGDGKVKCISSDNNTINCSVDTSKKKIIISPKSNSSVNGSVNVYATQGTAYSASVDNKINVSIKNESKPVVTNNIVKNIQVSGFNLGFKESTYSYNLKIKDQTRLNITCDLVSSDYRYVVEGNDYLKNGSVIYIIIYKGNTKVVTYTINISKEESSVPYREVPPVEESTPTQSVTPTPSSTAVSTPSLSEMALIVGESSTSTTTEDTTSTTTAAREYATNNSNSNSNTTVTVAKADPVVTNSNVEKKIVEVPNTEDNNSMIYYIIALSLLVLAYYIIKYNKKRLDNLS